MSGVVKLDPHRAGTGSMSGVVRPDPHRAGQSPSEYWQSVVETIRADQWSTMLDKASSSLRRINGTHDAESGDTSDRSLTADGTIDGRVAETTALPTELRKQAAAF